MMEKEKKPIRKASHYMIGSWKKSSLLWRMVKMLGERRHWKARRDHLRP